MTPTFMAEPCSATPKQSQPSRANAMSVPTRREELSKLNIRTSSQQWSAWLQEMQTDCADLERVPADSTYHDDMDALLTLVTLLEASGYFLPRRAPAYRFEREHITDTLNWLWKSIAICYEKAGMAADDKGQQQARRAHTALRNMRTQLFAAAGWKVEPR